MRSISWVSRYSSSASTSPVRRRCGPRPSNSCSGSPRKSRRRSHRFPARPLPRSNRRNLWAVEAMTTAPTEVREPEIGEEVHEDRPWVVIVWNDPVNLMSYVTFVLQKLFGYSKEKATKLMLDVHYKGKAVVSSGPRDKAEIDVFRLHEHGLWATLQHDE